MAYVACERECGSAVALAVQRLSCPLTPKGAAVPFFPSLQAVKRYALRRGLRKPAPGTSFILFAYWMDHATAYGVPETAGIATAVLFHSTHRRDKVLQPQVLALPLIVVAVALVPAAVVRGEGLWPGQVHDDVVRLRHLLRVFSGR